MPKGKEIGRAGSRRYNGIFFEEFLPELQGRRGVETYREMSENDSGVGGIMFAIEMLIRQANFMIEPAGNKAIDKEAAEFIESCMYDMQHTWDSFISEVISFLPYGWSLHEIVYKRRMGSTKNPNVSSKYDDGLIGWKKLPIRSQDTLYKWEYDEINDDLLGMWQIAPPNYNPVLIPIEKALHFMTTSRKANPEGRSILRTAYRDWYMKKRIEEIEGMGIERDLAGYPVMYAPNDIFEDDPEARAKLMQAENIVSGIRRDTREGVVLPPKEDGWELELLTSGSRRQFDTNEVINRYDTRIASSVLADFIRLGHEGVGSFALSQDKTKLFALAIGTYLDIICEVFNNQAIPRLIDVNGEHFKGISGYPEMRHSDIEQPNMKEFADALSSLVGSGALVPDENLEEYVRDTFSLPKRIEQAAINEMHMPKIKNIAEEEDAVLANQRINELK